AEIVAKQEGVIAGLEVAALAFALLDAELRFDALAEDGDSVTPCAHSPALLLWVLARVQFRSNHLSVGFWP
ncbi:MAG TPA: hypothetical protein GX715_12685, partial [Armatimonadetes bacterium]|nr:hypothetical protein [Armatimonadota bacterium]